jgi:hypothetical protein
MLTLSVSNSFAVIENCDFSTPADGDIDGTDLAQFIVHYAAIPPKTEADVNDSGAVNADDVGIDATSDMYPNLITDLLAQYGPAGHDQDDYLNIDGNPASTPVLDTLAQEGRRFSSAWADPFCSPTRAAIITGMYTAKTDVGTYDDAMSTNHTTFVQRLRGEAGYSTAIFGNWHLAGGWSEYNNAMPQNVGF